MEGKENRKEGGREGERERERERERQRDEKWKMFGVINSVSAW
jgi:hypothetical protein